MEIFQLIYWNFRVKSKQIANNIWNIFLFIFCFISNCQVIEVVRHPHDKAESKYNPDAGISKEDEERYQKLLLENEELQRLIVQVNTSF